MAPPSQRQFTYRSLETRSKEIRVLELHPGQLSDAVRCNVHHISLLDAEHTPYDAVSYCWSTLPGTTRIELDGCVFVTTASSEAALRHLRRSHASRVVWIDAICIDQSNLPERSHQVSLMREVYSQTTRTVVWLGPSRVDPDILLMSLDAVYEEMQQATDNFDALDDWKKMQKVLHDNAKRRITFDLASLAALYCSPWFSRVWILQEVALPPAGSCYYGDCEIPLQTVLRVGCWICWIYSSYLTPAAKASFSAVSDLGEYIEDREVDLYSLLLLCMHRGKTDSRDTVFGILGLVRHPTDARAAALLRPDYTKPLAGVLRDAVRCIISQDEDLALYEEELALPCYYPEAADFCSWAPLLHQAPNRTVCPARIPGSSDRVAILDGEVTTAMDGFEQDPDVLLLRGYKCSVVKETTEVYRSGQSPSAMLDFLSQALDLGEDASSDHGLTQIVNVVASTLLAGHLQGARTGLFEPVDDEQLGRDLAALLKHRMKSTASRTISLSSPPDGPAGTARNNTLSARYVSQLNLVCNNRRYFTGDQCLAGLGPPLTSQGDVVVLVYGCKFPLVLRPTKDDCYSLLGVCYIHSTMLAKLLQRVQRGAAETIRLR